jgi:cytoskeletal protein RodZ
MNLHIERRKRFRKRPPRLVYVELGNGNGGMMRDLSEDGFALRAMMPLATGEKLHFCLSLEDATRIEGESEVIWTGEGGRAAGLKFVEITPQARASIREWLASLEAPSKEESETKRVPSASELVERLKREVRNVPPRPVAVKQESSVSVAAPEPEQQELPPPPPSRHVEIRPAERASVASQILPPAPVIPPPAPAYEPPPAPVAQSPAAPSDSSATGRVPLWQKQPPVLVPLPRLEDETEGGELAAARAVRRSLFSRTFGIILLLGLGVGGWFYHEEVGYGLIWLGQQLAGVDQNGTQATSPDSASPSATSPSEASPAPAQEVPKSKSSAKIPGDAQKKPQPAPQASETPVQEQAAAATKEEADSAAPQPTTPESPTSTATTPSEPVPDAGQAEYMEAMRILAGNEANSRLPEAVRLLWIAVEKGNSNAEVTLAGLYSEGRGVKKNCEQTRVLLSAAARKGNALAQKNLQQFIREGCE